MGGIISINEEQIEKKSENKWHLFPLKPITPKIV